MARKKPVGRQRANRSSPDGRPAANVGQPSPPSELREANEQLVVAGVRMQELAEEARRREAEWNALLSSLHEGVIVADPAEHLVLANRFARENFALPPTGAPITGQDWAALDLRDLDGRPLVPEMRPLARALRGEQFDDFEVLLVCRDGRPCRCAFEGTSIRDETGKIQLAMVIFRDVTELRLLERAKEEYVSLISHDLRGALTIILGQAQVLCRFPFHADREQVLPMAEAIVKNGQRMNAMIQDLLDTARLEAGQTILHPERLDLRAVARDAIESLAPTEDEARVRVAMAESLPPVRADRRATERVIANLVSNALKFSPEGSPVEVDVRGRDGEVVVSVTDLGAGIPPEALPHLFEKYFRTTAGKEHGGLGLGLYLSRLIVDASGGRIWATSQVGQGSTFRFSLPVADQ